MSASTKSATALSDHKAEELSSNRRLIVNADGFGFGEGATRGIIDAIREGGFITSVSVNANFRGAEKVCELAAEFPGISIGVHLNPMAGRPCLPPSEVSSMVDAEGNFRNREFFRLLRRGKVCERELEAELNAQIKRVSDWVGGRLTHLDSQANSHLEYFRTFLGLARKWGIQRIRNNASMICLESPTPRISRLKAYLRRPHIGLAHIYRQHQMEKARRSGMRMADRLVTVGYAGVGNKTERDNWVRILRNLPHGTFEVYCHPAYLDDTLRRWSYYCDDRERELNILRSRELRELASDLGIQLLTFESV